VNSSATSWRPQRVPVLAVYAVYGLTLPTWHRSGSDGIGTRFVASRAARTRLAHLCPFRLMVGRDPRWFDSINGCQSGERPGRLGYGLQNRTGGFDSRSRFYGTKTPKHFRLSREQWRTLFLEFDSRPAQRAAELMKAFAGVTLELGTINLG
jgi:hypothetical protein